MAICLLGDDDDDYDDGMLEHSTQKPFQVQETFDDVTVQLRTLVLTKLGGCLS